MANADSISDRPDPGGPSPEPGRAVQAAQRLSAEDRHLVFAFL